MEFIYNNLLTLILFTPILAALVLLLLPRDQDDLIRWVALGMSLIPLVLSLALWFNFEPGLDGFQVVRK